MHKQLIRKVGNLTLVPNKKKVYWRRQEIPLRRKEYELLEFLALHSDRVLNKLTILECVWNYSSSIKTKTLEVHVTTLRKKLSRYTDTMIQTVHGIGYRLLIDSSDTQPRHPIGDHSPAHNPHR